MTGRLVCPQCQQPLPSQKCGGIYLPPLKARIFNLINLHPGIVIEALAWRIYRDKHKTGLIRQHVYQINSLLAGTRVQIRGQDKYRHGNGTYGRGCYRIIRQS